MAGPALLYLALVFAVNEPGLARGWAIPCATDIVFSYLVARLIFGAMLLSAALAIAWALRKRGTRSFWPYIGAAGVVSWVAFYRGGLHPALALVPVLAFLPHAARDPGLFVESKSVSDPLNEFEHWWKLPVQVILFFFGLVNAGVEFGSVGVGTWTVLGAILVGKPVGIVAATAFGVAMSSRWSERISGGSGFLRSR